MNQLLTSSVIFVSSLVAAEAAAAQGALPPPPTPFENPTTAEKAVLGKMLFWDEQLSSDGTMACGTCHMPSSGGADPRITNLATHPGPDGVMGTNDDEYGSIGVMRSDSFGHIKSDGTFGFAAQATDRTTPSMIAAAYFDELFWDGRATSQFVDPVSGATIIQNGGALESQSLQPLINDVEMAFEGRGWTDITSRLTSAAPMALATDLPNDVVAALAIRPDYPALFEGAFGTDEITPVRIAFALAAYQRTLIPDQSKFDRVMRGQAQFTQAENRGRGAFNSNQSRCNQCHSGSLFADEDFHNLGLRPVSEDQGRRTVTNSFGDRGKFKTPSLRNVSLRDRFFHTGAPGINNLPDVLEFYDDRGGNFNDNKDPLLNNIRVPGQVRNDIVAFLNTLTDPRVANEAAPFDRPTLWSERQVPNPRPLGVGAVPGSFGVVPQIIATAPAKEGNDGFRVSVHSAMGGSWAILAVNVKGTPAGGAPMASAPAYQRDLFPYPQVLSGFGVAGGYGTWMNDGATSAAMVGITYEAQWLIRDAGASGGVARTDRVAITIE